MPQTGTLFTFPGTPASASPSAPHTAGPRGSLYGTTQQGGPADLGTVFELSPNSSGGYTFTQLYAFQGNGDVQGPEAAPLLLDAAGNLYCTTPHGGASGGGAVYGVGPPSGGGWTERVIYSFETDSRTYFPNSGVIMDAAGNRYGSAEFGGSHSSGGVFELSRGGRGGR